jgi:4-carboxymuconolactone decarboxylase
VIESPRIMPVEDLDESQRGELAKTLLEPGAQPLNLFTTLAHHPLLLRRVNALGGVFIAHGQLSPRLRELVILRVAYRLRSSYEFAQHVVLGTRVGLTGDELKNLAGDLDPAFWDAETFALLGFVDQLLDDGTVSDASWDATTQRMSTSEVIELILLVGYYRMVADFLRTTRVSLEAHLAPPAWSD